MKTILLASASPARKQTLLNAGISPSVAVSNVDEDFLLAELKKSYGLSESEPPASDQVQLLAQAKASEVYARLAEAALREEPAQISLDSFATHNENNPLGTTLPTVVIGCDSMLLMNGAVVGKPHSPQVARARLREMSGRWGDLYTGHCVIDTATGTSAEGVSVARVHIAELSNAEIDAYVASGEPLHVAGSFTVDGLGGPFVEKIEGDYHGVVGISLPLVRNLLTELGHSIQEFWNKSDL
ncbi:Maf family protein [Arcanobacterium ihumii]|uniref:Maf family protein n=1 Tax=Arcanobacterium ihumii TaxID=2138162 RepID=UPI000F53E9EB|nr:Maf family protein [Arcanobacterium ihumii]